MTEATAKPAEYTELVQQGDSFHSFNMGHCEPSQYVDAQCAGWKLTIHGQHDQNSEDEADIQDSLEALKESKGVDLEDFRRELGV